MQLFRGVLDDSVPYARANTAARLAGVMLEGVRLECVHGPQLHRRKAVPLVSERRGG